MYRLMHQQFRDVSDVRIQASADERVECSDIRSCGFGCGCVDDVHFTDANAILNLIAINE